MSSKVLILMTHYERPNFLQIALHSIVRQTSSNWFLAFIDDGSKKHPGRSYVEKMLHDKLDQVKFYYNEQSPEEKIASSTCKMLKLLNTAMDECANDNDIIITLNDDDALFPNYVRDLNRYYCKSKDPCSISAFVIWDPLTETYDEALQYWDRDDNKKICVGLRSWDAQVSWRKNTNFMFSVDRYGGVGADREFSKIFNKFKYNGMIGKLKSFGPWQLGWQLWHRDRADYVDQIIKEYKLPRNKINKHNPSVTGERSLIERKIKYIIGVKYPIDLPYAPNFTNNSYTIPTLTNPIPQTIQAKKV